VSCASCACTCGAARGRGRAGGGRVSGGRAWSCVRTWSARVPSGARPTLVRARARTSAPLVAGASPRCCARSAALSCQQDSLA
jgi:hypothetical protein